MNKQAEALYKMGVLYCKKGTKEYAEKGMDCFRKASELGHTKATECVEKFEAHLASLQQQQNKENTGYEWLVLLLIHMNIADREKRWEEILNKPISMYDSDSRYNSLEERAVGHSPYIDNKIGNVAFKGLSNLHQSTDYHMLANGRANTCSDDAQKIIDDFTNSTNSFHPQIKNWTHEEAKGLSKNGNDCPYYKPPDEDITDFLKGLGILVATGLTLLGLLIIVQKAIT